MFSAPERIIRPKGFLICREDHDAIMERIRASGIDALAQDGAMLHIFSAGGMMTSELNQTINQRTSLPAYTEFVHTAQAIRGFMLILQNAFSGRLPALRGNGLTAVLGGVIGAALAALLTDSLVSSAMKLAGISNFASAASLGNTLLPAALVAGLFMRRGTF